MRVSVLTAAKTVYEGNVQEVILPGEDGEIGIMDFHQPFLYTLKKGFIIIKEKTEQINNKAEILKIPVRSGIARMRGNELSLCVILP